MTGRLTLIYSHPASNLSGNLQKFLTSATGPVFFLWSGIFYHHLMNIKEFSLNLRKIVTNILYYSQDF